MTEVHIQTQCEGCGTTVKFPASQLGTVPECPECQGWLDVPEVTRVPTILDNQAETYERQMEESARQQRVAAEQLEETARQQVVAAAHLDQEKGRFASRDRLDAIQEEMLKRTAILLERWEGLTERFEQTLQRLDSTDSD